MPRRRAARIDVFGDRRRADEADRLDVGIVEDRVDRLLVAVDDVENAGRAAGLDEQFAEPHRHAGVALGRLQDEGVAASDRRRELPQRDHGGEVERRDAGDDAERLAHRIGVDAGAGAVGVFALHQMRHAERELQHLDAALDVALGVGDRLAVLAGQDVGEFVVVFGDQFVEFHQDAGAALRIGRAPGGLRGLGVLDRRADFRLGGERDMGAHRAVHRLKDFGGAARFAGDMLAADEMPVLDHVSLPDVCCSGAYAPRFPAQQSKISRIARAKMCYRRAWIGTTSASSSPSPAPVSSSPGPSGCISITPPPAAASRRYEGRARRGEPAVRPGGARLGAKLPPALGGERFTDAAEQDGSRCNPARSRHCDRLGRKSDPLLKPSTSRMGTRNPQEFVMTRRDIFAPRDCCRRHSAS